MREILFRGKTKEGKWIETDSILRIENIGVKLWDRDDGWVEIISNTLGQFTGLTDKNGTKIFEGDIVKGLFLFGRAIFGVVDFQDGAFGLAWKRSNIDEFNPFPCMCNVDYEVIGIIHDNPELWEE